VFMVQGIGFMVQRIGFMVQGSGLKLDLVGKLGLKGEQLALLLLDLFMFTRDWYLVAEQPARIRGS